MNLIDIINKLEEIQVDSFCGESFGDTGQLVVVGYVMRKYINYILKCTHCSNDPELFGDGYFTALKANLEKGKVPCGCSSHYRPSEDQYKIICKRLAAAGGYRFKGWASKYNYVRTKLLLSCPVHGEWSTSNINKLKLGRGCPSCARCDPQDETINKFLSTGKFLEGTIFTQSTEINKKGHKVYWDVYCPGCMEVNRATWTTLYKGCLPCSCSKHNHKIAYINTIHDNDHIVALKFGVTKEYETRLASQNRESVFDICEYGQWAFPDRSLCLLAEKRCKDALVCGALTKYELNDGYTETTFTYNLDEIIRIYESTGGIRCEN